MIGGKIDKMEGMKEIGEVVILEIEEGKKKGKGMDIEEYYKVDGLDEKLNGEKD